VVLLCFVNDVFQYHGSHGYGDGSIMAGQRHEAAEVGKVAVGAGLGGFGGWLATMASVAGSGASFKVWTIWSVLLVAISGVAVVGGAVLWWVFHSRSHQTVIQVPPGTSAVQFLSGGSSGGGQVDMPGAQAPTGLSGLPEQGK
jgi:hypothetical protein